LPELPVRKVFFRVWEEAGIQVCASFSFSDHHRYTESELQGIAQGAVKSGAEIIITTAKDFARVPPDFREMIAIAEMEIDFGRIMSGLWIF